jgi:tetrahydromethanopterin S-methyltransferase subunit F
VEADLGQAITADQLTFRSGAVAGRGAFAGLAAGVIAAAVLMAAAGAWGLARRLAEYR